MCDEQPAAPRTGRHLAGNRWGLGRLCVRAAVSCCGDGVVGWFDRKAVALPRCIPVCRMAFISPLTHISLFAVSDEIKAIIEEVYSHIHTLHTHHVHIHLNVCTPDTYCSQWMRSRQSSRSPVSPMVCPWVHTWRQTSTSMRSVARVRVCMCDCVGVRTRVPMGAHVETREHIDEVLWALNMLCSSV